MSNRTGEMRLSASSGNGNGSRVPEFVGRSVDTIGEGMMMKGSVEVTNGIWFHGGKTDTAAEELFGIVLGLEMSTVGED